MPYRSLFFLPAKSSLLDPDSPTMIVHRDGIDTALEYREQFAMSGDQVRSEALVKDHLKNHYHKPSDDLSRPAWNEGDFFGELFAPED